MKVPIALIHSVCYPTSYRLPKLTRLEIPKHVTPPLPFEAYSHHSHTTGSYFRGQQGNLSHGDYRFFFGHVNKMDKTGSCRWCREVLLSESLRKKHKGPDKHNSCQDKLGKLFKTLLDSHHCIVCSRYTMSEHWGIPICLGECRDTFKFTQPVPLRTAIDRWKVLHDEKTVIVV